jgi:tetratricopeptide (TPR) repeat protein
MLKRLLMFLLILGGVGGGGYAAWRLLKVEPPLQHASRLIEAGDVFGAQVVLRGLIKSEPRNVEAHLMLAKTQLATDDWVSAEKEARSLRGLGYDRAAVAELLVRSYSMQGHYQDILTDVPAVAANPDEQYLNLVLRSVAFLGMKDVGLAQQLIDAAAALAPNAFLVHLQKARLLQAKGDVTAGLREINVALGQEPASVEALMVKSDLLVDKEDIVGAIRPLDEAVVAAPLDQDLLMKRAGLLLKIDADSAARADVNTVFNITPTNPSAMFYNALLIYRSGQLADANVEFDKLGMLADRFPKSYFYKAEIALKLGNKQSALESLDRFLRILPNDGEGLRLVAQIELGEAQPERAVAVLGPATGPGSSDAAAIDLLGRAYFMLGRMSDAISAYRRATAIAPGNKEYAAHLSAAQVQFGSAPVPGADVTDLPP